MYNYTYSKTDNMDLSTGMFIFVIFYAILVFGCCLGGCYTIRNKTQIKILPEV